MQMIMVKYRCIAINDRRVGVHNGAGRFHAWGKTAASNGGATTRPWRSCSARANFFGWDGKTNMKKRKKRSYHFKTAVTLRSSRPPVRDLEPETLAAYIRQAEKLVLPLIKDTGLGPGAAELLLAQYTQALVTGDHRITIESGMAIANTVLGLWQEGYYTPGPEYPYTLEETLQELEEGVKAKGDYAELFQPYASQNGGASRGFGEIAGQGFTPLPSLAHLDVEYLSHGHETGADGHQVNVAVLGRPLHTASPNRGWGHGH
jgi:hypothetical protein